MPFLLPKYRKTAVADAETALRNVNFKISVCQDFSYPGRLFAAGVQSLRYLFRRFLKGGTVSDIVLFFAYAF